MSEAPSTSRSDRILHAARAQFEATGFRKTSIAEIADDAGVAAGTIYCHFKSKEEHFLRLIDDDNPVWLTRARDALSQPGAALERLAALVRTSAETYQQSKLLLAILRRDRRMLPPPLLEDIHARLAKQSISLLREVIQQGIDEGSIRPVDAEKTAAVLFAAGHGLFNQSDYVYDELAQVLADVAFRGLARTDPGAPVGPGDPDNPDQGG